jgi:hypothetical protein
MGAWSSRSFHHGQPGDNDRSLPADEAQQPTQVILEILRMALAPDLRRRPPSFGQDKSLPMLSIVLGSRNDRESRDPRFQHRPRELKRTQRANYLDQVRWESQIHTMYQRIHADGCAGCEPKTRLCQSRSDQGMRFNAQDQIQRLDQSGTPTGSSVRRRMFRIGYVWAQTLRGPFNYMT